MTFRTAIVLGAVGAAGIFPASSSFKAAATRAQDAGGVRVAGAVRQGVAMPVSVSLQGSSVPPSSSPGLRAMRQHAADSLNKPRPRLPGDGVPGVGPQVAEAEPPLDPRLPAASTFTMFEHDLTDTEDNNVTSVIAEPSLAQHENQILYSGNWFAAASINGGSNFFYLNPDTTLPAINGQFFCCDQSMIYDRSRGMFIWVVLYINNAETISTIRIVGTSDFSNGQGFLYDFSPGQFGLGGVLDFPQISLGANFLYLTFNNFNPSFTESVLAALPLTEMRRHAPMVFSFLSRPEFNLKVVPDYGPGTRAFFATHVSNTTLRVFRWEEQSLNYFLNDVTVPAWTRGTRGDFVCTTPDTRNPCARMDDRVQGGFVKSAHLPQGNNGPPRIVGFTWTARQGGNFPMPYTNIVRIDPDTLQLVDNLAVWSASIAYFYGDFAPNDRGDLGGVLDSAGAGTYPTCVAALMDQDSGQTGFNLFTLRAGNASANAWGDFNTVHRDHVSGYQFVAGCHVLIGGSMDGNVVPVYARFWRERDGF